MSDAIDDLIALLPNARPERIASNVFDITISLGEADAFKAAIDTLQVYGARAIAYHAYDTFGEVRVRVTFRVGDVDPLLHFNKLRAVSSA